MGHFHNAFVLTTQPDWEGLRSLEVRACLRGYQLSGIWLLDVCPAHRLRGHVPFTEVFPSIQHPSAPVFEELKHESGADWLGLAFAVEAAAGVPVLAFGWDDETLDFAFEVADGRLQRFLSCPEGRIQIRYQSGEWQTGPAREDEPAVLSLWPPAHRALARQLGVGSLDFHVRALRVFERGETPGEPEQSLPDLLARGELAGALALLRRSPDLVSQKLRTRVCEEVSQQAREALRGGQLEPLRLALDLVGEHPNEPELLPLWNRLQLALGEACLAAGQAPRAMEPLRGIIRLTGMVTEEHGVFDRARELRPVAARQASALLPLRPAPLVQSLLADTATEASALTEVLSSEQTAWDCPTGIYRFENAGRGFYGTATFTPEQLELTRLVMLPHEAWFKISLAREDLELNPREAARRLSEAAFHCFRAGRPEYALVLTERALELDPENEIARQSLTALRARQTSAPAWAHLCLQ